VVAIHVSSPNTLRIAIGKAEVSRPLQVFSIRTLHASFVPQPPHRFFIWPRLLLWFIGQGNMDNLGMSVYVRMDPWKGASAREWQLRRASHTFLGKQ